MNLAEITHRAYFLACYPLDERHLKISIQTGKDVDEVILWAGDPYSAGIAENEQNWQGERVPMELERELAHRNVYSAVLTPAYRRVKYHFEITGGGESVCLFEDGFVKNAEHFPEERMIQRFIYPWMNRADIMKVPEWAENIVWYQIFPDRFCRKNPGEKRHSCREWACQEDATWKEFYGGDLAGIRSRLAYIADLGVGGIYLNPILWSDSNHRYDTIDYHSVEPDIGTEEELKALIAEAHALGLRVMIDAVFNHCGAKCALWQDVLEKMCIRDRAMGLVQLLLTVVIMVINQKFFISGFKSLWHRAPNMDTLVALGATAAFGYSTYALFAMTDAQVRGDMDGVMRYMHEFYFESAAMILTLITVGKMLESRSKGKTTDALKSLMSLAPKTATIVRDGVEQEVPVLSLIHILFRWTALCWKGSPSLIQRR